MDSGGGPGSSDAESVRASLKIQWYFLDSFTANDVSLESQDDVPGEPGIF